MYHFSGCFCGCYSPLVCVYWNKSLYKWICTVETGIVQGSAVFVSNYMSPVTLRATPRRTQKNKSWVLCRLLFLHSPLSSEADSGQHPSFQGTSLCLASQEDALPFSPGNQDGDRGTAQGRTGKHKLCLIHTHTHTHTHTYTHACRHDSASEAWPPQRCYDLLCKG